MGPAASSTQNHARGQGKATMQVSCALQCGGRQPMHGGCAGAVLVWGFDRCGSIGCGDCTMHLTCTKVTASAHSRRQRVTVAEQLGDQVQQGALVAHVEVFGGAQQLADTLYCLSIACAIGTGLSNNT